MEVLLNNVIPPYNSYMSHTREYMRSYYYKRRDEYIALLGGKCMDCGSTEDLQFDHKNPDDKKFNVAPVLTHSRAKVLPEILKCQLLCGVHHNDKTDADGSRLRGILASAAARKGIWEHGTQSGYRLGCRCSDCKSEYSVKRKEHYLRTKN